MTEAFPHHYQVALEWDEGRTGHLSAPPRPEIQGGPPPEFGGTDRWWSPEHLLLSALGLCYLTTYLALAERAKVALHRFDVQTEGTLDKTRDGLVFTAIVLHVEMTVADGDRERAEALVPTAKKHCIVSNALKTDVRLDVRVGP